MIKIFIIFISKFIRQSKALDEFIVNILFLKKFVMISGTNCPEKRNTTKKIFNKIFSYRKLGRKNTFGIGGK